VLYGLDPAITVEFLTRLRKYSACDEDDEWWSLSDVTSTRSLFQQQRAGESQQPMILRTCWMTRSGGSLNAVVGWRVLHLNQQMVCRV
jgi:hypothetical protein